LEGELSPDMSEQGIKDFYQEILQQKLNPAKITIPLLIDRTSFEDGATRIHNAYFSALVPAWGGQYGTHIYDREGRILASIQTPVQIHEPEHVLEFMKKLRTRN
jgi:hypothetical protein